MTGTTTQVSPAKPAPTEEMADTGLLTLMMMAALHGVATDAAKLKHEFGQARFSTQTILLAAKALGLRARKIRQNPGRLNRAPLPAIAIDKTGHYFIANMVGGTEGSVEKILIQRPGKPPQVVALSDFLALWTGDMIFVTSEGGSMATTADFDFTWFIPAIVRYRKPLAEILLISLVLQLVCLATPLFFQVVLDKVLLNHAMKTLNVVAVGLILATSFDAMLKGIRSYVFANTSSKIDVELGARLFKHLLNLPIDYFETRRVGDSIARIREMDNIRGFLGGNAVVLMMDTMFSFVALAVMPFYSARLTLIVVLSIPVYLTISLIFTPIIRSHLSSRFKRGVENQSFLIETVSGIDTVKSMAVEPGWLRKWEQQLAPLITSNLSAINTGMLASGSASFVSRLVTIIVMWAGASLVVEGKLTAGELIAFSMLSCLVSSPILRLSQLWNDFQQLRISVSGIGDLMNAKTETVGRKTKIPRISGAIEFDQVSFRYRSDAADVIRAINLKIAPGEFVGIVGRSGAGKSTLIKLVQRLYVPNRGRVMIDGQDIAIIDTASLRCQIGVVGQESVLFSRSVRDNIALSNPSLPIDVIVEAATLAGAHDFICELPEGYDTKIGERGNGLSAGQKQRIAIARALIGNPRILIFDEATKALDYESEKAIRDNMPKICAGRTVLTVSHQLSSLRKADRIIVLERGQISEQGSHDELMQNPAGIYRHLYRLQMNDQNVDPQRTNAVAISTASRTE